MPETCESVFYCMYDGLSCDRLSKRRGTSRVTVVGKDGNRLFVCRCVVADKYGNILSVCPRLDKKRTGFVDADVSLEGVPVK